jgi:predicted HicB family RNase H-like nuclease
MTNTMTYKGYAARIEYDDEDGIFTGRIAGIRDGVGFHADTVEGLREAFHEAVEDYIETCAKIGKEPQKTYSGQVMFRVSPDVHRKAALAAELSGKSLNQWAEEVLGSGRRLTCRRNFRALGFYPSFREGRCRSGV